MTIHPGTTVHGLTPAPIRPPVALPPMPRRAGFVMPASGLSRTTP